MQLGINGKEECSQRRLGVQDKSNTQSTVKLASTVPLDFPKGEETNSDGILEKMSTPEK